MGEYPDFRKPERDEWADADAEVEQQLISQQSLQEIAHERGRICKKRGCVVCAPLVERRREKKKLRKAEAQAALHKRGLPCTRTSCELPVCLEARNAAAAEPTVETRPRPQRNEEREDAATKFRREVDRHKAGLHCGSEDCPNQECIDGFANERKRRHRARRPCRAANCSNAICRAGRSTR